MLSLRSSVVAKSCLVQSIRALSTGAAAPPPDAAALALAKKKEDDAKALARAKDVSEGTAAFKDRLDKLDHMVTGYDIAISTVLMPEIPAEEMPPVGELGFLSGNPAEFRQRKVIIKKKVRTTTMSNQATRGGLYALHGWTLTFETHNNGNWTNPLTGWGATADALAKFKLTFDTLDEAVNYAKRQNLTYEVRGDNTKREATLEKRDKHQIYDHNFLGPDAVNYLKKHGAAEGGKLWAFEKPNYSYWTNSPRSDYGPDKYDKKSTPTFE